MTHHTTLLTGATGFVGGELLARLVRDPRRSIVALVRGRDDADAKARGEARLHDVLGRRPSEIERARVRWVCADLERPSLGLSECTRRALTESLHEVFHCAASVAFDLPLADAQRINVDGTRHLLELAAEAQTTLRRFHHVSTAFAAGRVRGRVSAGHLPSDRARNFRNTYERTKARAERLLRSQREVPVTIYRPSVVAGDTRTGYTDNWNVLYVPMRQIALGRMPFLRCGRTSWIDTVGIDFVVDGMLALANRATPHGTTYHLTADHRAFDVRAFIQACNEEMAWQGSMARSRPVGPASWWLRTRGIGFLARAPKPLRTLRSLGAAVQRGLASFAPYEPYTAVATRFDAEREHALLAQHGIHMPPAKQYLQTIVSHAVTSDFGRKPLQRQPVAPAFIEAQTDEPHFQQVQA